MCVMLAFPQCVNAINNAQTNFLHPIMYLVIHFQFLKITPSNSRLESSHLASAILKMLWAFQHSLDSDIFKTGGFNLVGRLPF